MIKEKKDLEFYLKKDKEQLGISKKKPRWFTDEIWKYEIALRKYEYWLNIYNDHRTVFSKICCCFSKFKWHRLGMKLGIGIAPNVCGYGLSIAHIGCIEINDKAVIGNNLRIHEGVTIGASGGGAPRIGNNVFLSSGCKVIGEVTIADDCVVGANAVVVKDILEAGTTHAGVPSRKISNNDSSKFVFWYRSE